MMMNINTCLETACCVEVLHRTSHQRFMKVQGRLERGYIHLRVRSGDVDCEGGIGASSGSLYFSGGWKISP